MSFIDLFKSRESCEKLSHLKNLVAVAFADGKLEDNEMAALATVMARDDLTPSDLEKYIKETLSDIKIPEERANLDKDNILKGKYNIRFGRFFFS